MKNVVSGIPSACMCVCVCVCVYIYVYVYMYVWMDVSHTSNLKVGQILFMLGMHSTAHPSYISAQ
jgi:hypothetical protein